MRERILLINADDFGMAHSVNRAVQRAYRAGAITQTSLLAPAECAGEAAEIAAREGIPVGVHWTLHSEWADSRWTACAADAPLPHDANAVRAMAARAVTEELDAQYARIVRLGVQPTHADCHGTALYGMNGRLFFLNAFRLARRYRLPFRFPRRKGFLVRQFRGKVPIAVRAAHGLVVCIGRAQRVVLPDEFVTNPDTVARIGSYEVLREYYFRELAAVRPGITELVLHPAEPDANMVSTEWQKRVWELQLLLSGDLLGFVREQGFTLRTWAEIMRKPCAV